MKRLLYKSAIFLAISLFFSAALVGCAYYDNALVSTIEALNKRKLKTCGETNGALVSGVASGSLRTVFGTGGMTPTDCKEVLK